MIILLKRLIKLVCYRLRINWLFLRLVSTPMVLGYHRVTDDGCPLLVGRVGACQLADFEGQLAYLDELGCRFMPLGDVLNGCSGVDVAITFDDGFRDIYDNAFPILKARNIPFTLFFISSTLDARRLLWQHEMYSLLETCFPERRSEVLKVMIGSIYLHCDQHLRDDSDLISAVIHGSKPHEIIAVIDILRSEVDGPAIRPASLYLTSIEVQEMLGGGMLLEAHGHEHWNLTTLNDLQLSSEIVDCGRVIEEVSGRHPNFYAVAHGQANENILEFIRELGYDFIVDGSPGFGVDRKRRLIHRIWPSGKPPEFAWLITRMCLSNILQRLKTRVSRV